MEKKKAGKVIGFVNLLITNVVNVGANDGSCSSQNGTFIQIFIFWHLLPLSLYGIYNFIIKAILFIANIDMV